MDKRGFLEAEKILLSEKNTLFESLVNKLTDYPELKHVLYELLFTGKAIPYNPLNKYFNKKKEIGVKEIGVGNKVLVEAVV